MYGNEKEVGAALKAAGVPREKLFICTKYDPKHGKPVEESFSTSLRDMGIDYVDLYLLHEPFSAKGDEKVLQDQWAQMEAIHASGRAKSIGVSNFRVKELEHIMQDAEFVPAVNQVRCTLLCQGIFLI